MNWGNVGILIGVTIVCTIWAAIGARILMKGFLKMKANDEWDKLIDKLTHKTAKVVKHEVQTEPTVGINPQTVRH
jgi:hypothetical protein